MFGIAAAFLTASIVYATNRVISKRELLRQIARESDEIDVTPPGLRRAWWYSVGDANSDDYYGGGESYDSGGGGDAGGSSD